MKPSLPILLIIALISSVSHASSSFFLSASYGGNWLRAYKFTSFVVSPNATGKEYQEPGTIASLQLGKYWLPYFATTIEGLRATNRADYGQIGSRKVNLIGDYTQNALMINALLIYPKDDYFVRPYVGIGIGEVWVDADVTSQSANPLVINDTSNKFGYQFKAGLMTSFKKCYQFYLEYRHLGSNNQIHKNTNSVQPRDFVNNSASIGIQISL